MLEYVDVDGVKYSVCHERIEVVTECGKRSVKIAGWKKTKGKELNAGRRIDYYERIAV